MKKNDCFKKMRSLKSGQTLNVGYCDMHLRWIGSRGGLIYGSAASYKELVNVLELEELEVPVYEKHA